MPQHWLCIGYVFWLQDEEDDDDYVEEEQEEEAEGKAPTGFFFFYTLQWFVSPAPGLLLSYVTVVHFVF